METRSREYANKKLRILKQVENIETRNREYGNKN